MSRRTTINGKAPPPPRPTQGGGGGKPPLSRDEQSWLFRQSFDNAFDLIWVTDLGGAVLETNRTALKQRNLKEGDVRGRALWLTPWWDISPDAQARLRSAIGDAARGRTVVYEADLLGADGAPCTYDLRIKPLAAASGGRRYLRCAARDISECKRVERALMKAREDLEFRVQARTADLAAANEQLQREIARRQQTEATLRDSEARMHAILQTAVDAIITIDPRGTMTSFNPAAERMFGYKADEALGRNVKMLMPDPYYSEHDQYLDNYLRTGRPRIIGIGREVLGRRKDGHTFPIDLAVSEVRLGEQRTFTGIARDITDRKRMEREVLEISDQEQLRIGQDLHDGLGQELTGVAFLAKVLGEDLAAEKSSHAPSARKIAQLVQDAISRTRDLARGLSPVGLEAQGLSPALHELARHTDEVLGIRCAFINSQQATPAEATANVHLYRIAQESVNNAIKHAKAQSITIRLAAAGGEGILSVEDDGVGCRPDRARTPGMGLRIMTYRAGLIGAALTIGPSERGGTVVKCVFRAARGRRQEQPYGIKRQKGSAGGEARARTRKSESNRPSRR